MKSPFTPLLKKELFALALLACAGRPASALTTYQWSGGTSTNWQLSANWLATPGMPTPNTSLASSQLNVSTTNAQLVYSAAEGTTTFNAGSGNRGFTVGLNNIGQMTITGGTFATISDAKYDMIGYGNAGVGTMIIDGGTYRSSVTNSTVGLAIASYNGASAGSAKGTLTVKSGTATIGGSIGMGNSTAGSSATINLNGGELSTTAIIGTTSNVSSTINFNGGTLKAGASTTTLISNLTAAKVLGGGAVFDTNGYNITIGQALISGTANDGGLTKNGTGALTLTGINTYSGATSITGGTLALGLNGSISNTSGIGVSNGATFDVGAKSSFSILSGQTLTNNGTVTGNLSVGGALSGTGALTGNLTVISGGALSVGSTPGTQTIGGDLTLMSSAMLAMRLQNAGLGGTDYDQLHIAGNVALGGTLALTLGSVINPDDVFNLILDSGAGSLLSGSFTAVTVGGVAVTDYDGNRFSYGGQQFELRAANIDGIGGLNDLQLTVVPEPSTWAMVVGGVGMLALGQRFRRGRNR